MVSVDQKIWVKDYETEKWKLRHFSHWSSSAPDRVCCFINGLNSTQTDEAVGWNFYSINDPSILIPQTFNYETWYAG